MAVGVAGGVKVSLGVAVEVAMAVEVGVGAATVAVGSAVCVGDGNAIVAVAVGLGRDVPSSPALQPANAASAHAINQPAPLRMPHSTAAWRLECQAKRAPVPRVRVRVEEGSVSLRFAEGLASTILVFRCGAAL